MAAMSARLRAAELKATAATEAEAALRAGMQKEMASLTEEMQALMTRLQQTEQALGAENAARQRLESLLATATAVAVAGAAESSGSGPTLAQLGYDYVQLDDGYQHCGAGVNKSFHDAAGKLLVDPKKFSSLASMNARIHALNLSSGWYLNN
eukprot:COSAG06_NODE_21905_length_741_cov_1.096573_1_plen_151_part_10